MTPDILWHPKHPESSNLWAFMTFVGKKHHRVFDDYETLYRFSIEHSDLFWSSIAEYFEVNWTIKPTKTIDYGAHFIDTSWFPGGTLNYAEHLLKRNDSQLALISLQENGERKTITYQQLKQDVANCAEGLRKQGVQTGDRVAGILPNIIETVIAMLASATIGAIWSSCSPDFGVDAALDRLSQIEPKLLFLCDGHRYQGKTFDGQEKHRKLIQALPSLRTVVMISHVNQTIPRYEIPTLQWNEFLIPDSLFMPEPMPFDSPLAILFSSGTTGKPKCIVHRQGGVLLQHLKELALHTDLSDKDIFCFYTTTGWMMWNWMISALALGTTIVLYEGSPTYPSMTHLLTLIEQENITVFGTSPKFLSTLQQSEIPPFNLKSLRTILSTGAPLLSKHYDFIRRHIKKEVQISSISGGTDIISCFALGNPLLPVYQGELQCIGLGMAVQVFNEQGQPVIEEQGELVCTQPFPSMPLKFWHDAENQAYLRAYFSKDHQHWFHGDFVTETSRHTLIIDGRSDAVLNPGGVRIGTAEIYRQVDVIPDIAESVVIAQPFQDDVRIVLFIKLNPTYHLTDALITTIKKQLKENASPRHVPAKIIEVHDIPRTHNGKITELAVRQAVMGEPIKNIDSIANPESLLEYQNLHGYPI